MPNTTLRNHLLGFILLAVTPALHAATTTWAATNAGPYKSTDGGNTWQSVRVTVSNSLLQGVPNVAAIAVDPIDPATVYFLGVVTGTSAFYKSTDGGQTWSAVLLTGVGIGTGCAGCVNWLYADPVATNNIYVCASSKLVRSTDGGATWSNWTIPGGASAIATDPNTSGVVYASSIGAISKSTDFGNTWTTVRPPFSSPTLGGIFVDPNDSRRVFVAHTFGQPCSDTSRMGVDCGFFRSLDAGQTWQRVPIPGTSRSVAYDRATGDIYAGANQPGVGSAVIKSSDQGNTWTPLIKGQGGFSDGPWVSADPSVAGSVYSVGDTVTGGLISKTGDAGANWRKVTLPAYCTGPAATCPSNLQGQPQLYALAYTPPPRPPAGSVTRTVSAASLLAGPVAAESIVIATGSRLATASATGDLYQPPTVLAGTTVKVTDSAGVTRPAVLFSVSATQVVYQIPPGTAAGTATVTITAGDGVSATVQIQVAAVAPGIYTLNPSSLVKAYALRIANGNMFIEDVYDIDATGAVVARPITVSNGDQVYLIAYGTGFRAAGGDIGATVGGVMAPILYSGPQGVQPGLDQFNILIPPELGTGAAQSVQIVLTASGQTANTVNVTVQ